MITQADIDAFAEGSTKDVQAALEYARRARKGLPSDRWTNGVTGAESVARGIEALFQINEMLSGAFLSIWHEKMQSDLDGMGLGEVPEKYRTPEAGA